LSRALGSGGNDEELGGAGLARSRVDASRVYLDAPGAIRVTRVGATLSTWRIRHHDQDSLLLWHPALRNRRDLVLRLEEELASIFGLRNFRTSALSARVSIRFDAGTTTAERVMLELEKAWPRFYQGLDGPPSRTRLFAAGGLAALSFTGQYLVPAVRPFAVAGVAVYAFPNVVNAAKDLRHGKIGLPALYSTGLAFMLISGMPFTASVMASVMQLFPELTRRKVTLSQRRLFAAHRRRPTWARLWQGDGAEVEVESEQLQPGDRIIVRAGEVASVDGVVDEGFASIIDSARLGDGTLEDRSTGDLVHAGAFVREGSLTLRVERSGAETAANYVDSLLPHGTLSGLPSQLEAERIAHRNAKPALAVAATSLLLNPLLLQPAQAVVRPDYATALRLSAQLSTQRGIAEAWQRGILLRRPGALDRLATADTYVIDDSTGINRPTLQVEHVEALEGVLPDLVVRYALGGLLDPHLEQSRAMATFVNGRYVSPQAGSLERLAGVKRYRDVLGSKIEISGWSYIAASKLPVPEKYRSLLKAGGNDNGAAIQVHAAGAAPPALWVVRDGVLIGIVSFARTGEPSAKGVLAALREHDKRARIVYLSTSNPSETGRFAEPLRLDHAYGGLSTHGKLAIIRELGPNTLWIGDGSELDSHGPIAASAVSASLAPLSSVQRDAADILLLRRGFGGITDAVDLGRAHARRLSYDRRLIHTTNLLGAAGAFVANLTGLQTGLLSEFGAGLIYSRHAWKLERLVSSVEARRAQLTELEVR
jgi:cation transport ATPase